MLIVHFPNYHHKHTRRNNALNTFPRRILLFTIHCLLSKTSRESEYFPSAFEQEIDLEAAYIREDQAPNFVLHPLSARDGEYR